MKQLFVLLIFLPHLLFAQVEFLPLTWKEALAASAETGKIIFVDVYTSWCGPCLKMDKEVFSRPDVAALLNTNFINIKANAEANGRSIAYKYRVKSYPYMLFIRSDGRVMDEIDRELPAERFMVAVKTINDRANLENEIALLLQRWETEPHTPELAKRYFQLLQSGNIDRSQALEKWLSELSPDAIAQPEYERILLLNITRTDGNAFKIICQKQPRPSYISNKINNLLQMQCTQACENGRLKDLDTLLHATDFAFRLSPETRALRNAQYSNQFHIENKKYDRFTGSSSFFIEHHFFPLMSNAVAVKDSSIYTEYLHELNNIAWQYAQYVKNKTALTTAAGWLLKTNDLAGQSATRLHYAATLFKKAGLKEQGLDHLKQAIELGKKSGLDVSELEKEISTYQH